MSMRLLLELLLLASDLSGLAIPDQLPEVRVVAGEDMPCACVGAYQDNVLWVREDMDLQQPHGRSVLVHELTHHLQVHERGRPRDAVARFAYEGEAVDAQNRYLKLVGSARRAAVTHRTDE